jgi:hypothetical protein
MDAGALLAKSAGPLASAGWRWYRRRRWPSRAAKRAAVAISDFPVDRRRLKAWLRKEATFTLLASQDETSKRRARDQLASLMWDSEGWRHLNQLQANVWAEQLLVQVFAAALAEVDEGSARVLLDRWQAQRVEAVGSTVTKLEARLTAGSDLDVIEHRMERLPQWISASAMSVYRDVPQVKALIIEVTSDNVEPQALLRDWSSSPPQWMPILDIVL